MTTNNAGAESLNEELKLGVHYTLYKDGKGNDQKVAIAEHPLFAPRNYGTITLEAFRVSKNHLSAERPDIETKSIFRAVKDRATGLWFGHPIGTNDHDKQIKWRPFPLKMLNTFDLTKLEDRRQWAMLSRDGRVDGSPNQSGKPLYKVIDSARKSMDYMETHNKKQRCFEVLKGLNYEQMIELSPAIGINSSAFSQVELLAEFHRYAENNFQKFLDLWDSPTRQVVTIFKRAMRTGIIQHKIIEGTNGMLTAYCYEALPLGATESEAVAWLSDTNRNATLTSIIFRVKEAERSVHQGNYKVAPADKTKDLESEVERLQKELAAAKKSSIAYGSEKVVAIPGIQHTKEGPVDVDTIVNREDAHKIKPNVSELEELRREAKALKIQGAHLTKNPETLRQKIAEARNKIVPA